MSSRRSASTRPPDEQHAAGDLVDDAVVGRVVVAVEGDGAAVGIDEARDDVVDVGHQGVDGAEGRRAGDVGEVRCAAALRDASLEAARGPRRARRVERVEDRAGGRGELGGGLALGVAGDPLGEQVRVAVDGAVDRVQRLGGGEDQRELAPAVGRMARSTWRAYWRIRTFSPSPLWKRRRFGRSESVLARSLGRSAIVSSDGGHVARDLDHAHRALRERQHQRGLRERHRAQQRLEVEAVGDLDHGSRGGSGGGTSAASRR